LYVASGDFNITCFTQAAAQVAPTPTPTPTPTPAPTSTPPPSTVTPLRQGVTWDQLYAVTLIIIVAVIIAIGLVAAAVLTTLRKIARAKP